jgi:hypothetical protein
VIVHIVLLETTTGIIYRYKVIGYDDVLPYRVKEYLYLREIYDAGTRLNY